MTTQTSSTTPTAALVHGAFADAGSLAAITGLLLEAGVNVQAIVNPLRGLAVDSAYVASAIAQIPGPVLAVGHSYGGAAITNAATGAPNVVGLVYICGFAPEENGVHDAQILRTADRPGLTSRVARHTLIVRARPATWPERRLGRPQGRHPPRDGTAMGRRHSIRPRPGWGAPGAIRSGMWASRAGVCLAVTPATGGAVRPVVPVRPGAPGGVPGRGGGGGQSLRRIGGPIRIAACGAAGGRAWMTVGPAISGACPRWFSPCGRGPGERSAVGTVMVTARS